MTAKQAGKLLKKLQKAEAIQERANDILSEVRGDLEAAAQEVVQ